LFFLFRRCRSAGGRAREQCPLTSAPLWGTGWAGSAARTGRQAGLGVSRHHSANSPFSGRLENNHRRSPLAPRHSVTTTTSFSSREAFLVFFIGNDVTSSGAGRGAHSVHEEDVGGGAGVCVFRQLACPGQSASRPRAQVLVHSSLDSPPSVPYKHPSTDTPHTRD
jgi:hypothetical protein